jgi:hypothetical protein
MAKPQLSARAVADTEMRKKRKAVRSFLTLRGKRITRGTHCEREKEINFFLFHPENKDGGVSRQ